MADRPQDLPSPSLRHGTRFAALPRHAICIDKCHIEWEIGVMKTTTTIDSAGRVVIPKRFRVQYGLEAGQNVVLIDAGDGLTIVADQPARRFVKEGPVTAIDRGAGTAPLETFDVSAARSEHLSRKVHAHRR